MLHMRVRAMLGSARVSRAGFCVPQKQALPIARPRKSPRRWDTAASTRDARATRSSFC